MLKDQYLETICFVMLVARKRKASVLRHPEKSQKHNHKIWKKKKIAKVTKRQSWPLTLPTVFQGTKRHGSKRTSVKEYSMSSTWRGEGGPGALQL